MRVAELEVAPFRMAVRGPTARIASEREDVGPADRLRAPAERLCHRLPHCDHDGRKHEVVRRTDEVFPCLGARLGVAELDECGGGGTREMRLTAAFDELCDRFSGSEWDRIDDDRLAACGSTPAVVERFRD